MKKEDVNLINKILIGRNQPLPIPDTLKIEDDKLHMDVYGTASTEGSGVVNALLLAGINAVIDEDFTTDENRALDDEGIVHIWFRLVDVNQLWRK